MTDWFSMLSAEEHLSPDVVNRLRSDGFVVVPGPVHSQNVAALARSYDHQVSEASPEDIRIGSTTTRVRDFVNRGQEFDDIYLYPPLLHACCAVIRQPFNLSTMHARTLRPHAPAQALHVDFASDAQGWPMIGFIFMIDEFTPDNGATCFLPGSQGMKALPATHDLVPACGPAGSLIVFNGSAWHGHGENHTDNPRRSIQGAYIRRTETSGEDLPARMQPETLARTGELAKYLLAL